MSPDIGRNDPCHCGSGKKYKKCHLEKDELADSKKRAKAALNAAKVAAEKEAEKTGHKPERKLDKVLKPVKQLFNRATFFRRKSG